MLPIYRRLATLDELELTLLATGSHFSKRYGLSIDEVRASGLPFHERPVTSEEPLLASAQILTQVGLFLQEWRPKALMILGDRYEMLACAQAAMHVGIPMIHIGGGYVTEGAIDDRIRHAITKLAHRHLAANEQCARRLIQMGEPPEHVTVVGAPDLDMIRETKQIPLETLMLELELDPEKPYLLVTVHPETHRRRCLHKRLDAFFEALRERPEQIVISAPAAEEGAEAVFERINALEQDRDDIVFRRTLGRRAYVSAMQHCAAVVGNSSSGIIESSYFPVPSVNIGNRQKGRMQGANVLSTKWDHAAIDEAISQAVSPEFRAAIVDMKSPYGDGNTADRVMNYLLALPQKIRRSKPFRELDWS